MLNSPYYSLDDCAHVFPGCNGKDKGVRLLQEISHVFEIISLVFTKSNMYCMPFFFVITGLITDCHTRLYHPMDISATVSEKHDNCFVEVQFGYCAYILNMR